MEDLNFEVKPFNYFFQDQEDPIIKSNNEILSTKPQDLQGGEFDFNQNYSFCYSNFDYSAECKDLEQQLMEECSLAMEEIENDRNIY